MSVILVLVVVVLLLLVLFSVGQKTSSFLLVAAGALAVVVLSAPAERAEPKVSRLWEKSIVMFGDCSGPKPAEQICSMVTDVGAFEYDPHLWGDTLAVGDTMFVERRDFGSRTEDWNCHSNGGYTGCVGARICHWWMPCFEKD